MIEIDMDNEEAEDDEETEEELDTPLATVMKHEGKCLLD
jgi:hypothetical protein